MPDLFSTGAIERLHGVMDGARISVPNGSEARWARDASGRQWVRKRESDTGFQPLLAESIGFLLGNELQLRQPAGALFHDGGEWSWMSERIALAGEHWHHDMRDFIDNPDEVSRMLVLDALLVNEDRHRRNILVEPVDDIHLRLWSIDFGNALVGQPSDFVAFGLQVPSVHNHARGLPVTALAQGALDGAQAAVQLSEDKIRAIVAEGCALAREPSVVPITQALLARFRDAPTIVSGYLEALGALS